MFNRLSKRFNAKNEKKGWNKKVTIDGLPYYFNNETGELSWEDPKEAKDNSKMVWIPHPDFLWQPAKLVGDSQVQLGNGKKVDVKKGIMKNALTGGRTQEVALWNVKASSLRMPEEDLVALDDPNEALIIHNLRVRYDKDELYTWLGANRNVLVSINPFKNVDSLYNKSAIELHQNRPPNKPLPPHVYDIGNDSYRALLYEKKNQSILISGESGAGKTFCTKQILNFLAEVAGSVESDIEEKILMANPLLEAFGNAQTVRNNNSSRFGKFIDVHFDSVSSIITSASIEEYLLEKSRVVLQGKGERNYHIFYQLTKDTNTKSKLGLEAPSHYNYLNKSGCYDANHIDDIEEHSSVLEAFKMLGFSQEEQDFAMEITAGVLNLGNVEFKSRQAKGGVEGSKLADSKALKSAAGFLGVTEKELERVVTHRSISVRGVVSTIPLDPESARKGTDSLAMYVYGKLFSWLVDKVNTSLEGPRAKSIGLLDIFGFEIFENNSFEQLLINFTNEKLQQQFNKTTFKNEEALYQREGIDFKHIEFIDNQVVLDLIEKRPQGLLMVLDDETKLGKGNDVSFVSKVETMHRRNEKFQTDKHRRLKDSLNFEVAHYAGIVNYNASGFKVKNTDTLFQDMYDVMAGSSHQFIKFLFPIMDTRRQQKSLSYQFRRQLGDLMSAIAKTESRYVRCIKPNDSQVADRFDAPMVLDQLKYSGIFEAVEIRRQGYPFRLTYRQFACQYACINPDHKYKARRDPQKLVREILSKSKQDFTDVAFGKTLVLYRSKEHKLLLLMRNLALETLIPKQQAVLRGNFAREMRRRLLKCEQQIQNALDVGNDIEMLDRALKAVKPTIAELGDMFPGYMPRNLKEGEKHRDNLQLWMDLQAKLEKLVQEDPNKMYYKLADAVEAGTILLNEGIPQTDRQKELMDEAIKLRMSCELGKIDAEAKEALEELDEDRMVAVLERAKDKNHSSSQLKEIERLLNLPEIEWLEMLLESATKKNDEDRRIELEIRLETLRREADPKYREISNLEGLKDSATYAKGKLMGKKKAAERMLYHTKSAASSLLSAVDDKATVKEVLKCAKQIRQFMGDAKGKLAPVEIAASLSSSLLHSKEPIVDELYLQLLKQLRDNPSEESLATGYDLMGIFMLSAAPSTEVARYTLTLLAHAPNGNQRFCSALNKTIYGKASAIRASEVESILKEFNGKNFQSRYSKKREVVDESDSEPEGEEEEEKDE